MDGNIHRKALKSGIWYTVTNFTVRGLAFLTTPIFTRMLTKEEYGAFSNYTAWLGLLTILTTLDLYTSVQRAVFDFKEDIDGYLSSVLTLGALVTVVCYFIVLVFGDFFTQLFDMNIIYINIMFMYMLVSPAIQLLQTKHRFEMKYKFVTALTFLSVFSTVGISVVLVWIMQNRLLGRVIGQSITLTIVNLFIAGYIIFKGRKFKLEYCQYALIIAVPLIPHLLGGSLLGTTDRIVINKFCGEEYTALYSVVYTCSMVVILLQTSLNMAWNPWFFEHLYKEDYIPVRKVFKTFVLMFCAIAYSLILFAPEIIHLVGGKAYSESVLLMPPIMMGCVCLFMYSLYVSTEMYCKKNFGIALRTITAGIFNLVTNIIFVPLFGYAAAAYTTLVSYFLLLILHWRAGKKLGVDNYFDSKFIFAATGVMAVLSALALAVYSVRWLRLGLSGLFLVALLMGVWKYRAKLMEIYKMFGKEKTIKC